MVSADYRKICWFYDDQLLSSKIVDRQFDIQGIQSLIYGPHTITFKQWRLRELSDCMTAIIE
jgi:hypothetical protein